MRQLITNGNQWLIKRLPVRLVFWLTWPHEVFHYLAARALGLPARFEVGRVIYWPKTNGQRLVVLLAPAVLGLLVLWPSWQLTWLWLAGCTGDFLDAWKIVSRGTKRA